MNAPLDLETLADWVDGRLDADRAAAVAVQVEEGDSRTRALVEWLRGIVDLGRAFPLEQPPLSVRQRLTAHFAAWRDTELALAAELRSLDAKPVFDSRDRHALAGVRGVVADDVVHLAYTTEAVDGALDLVLEVRRLAGHRVRIDGQVLAADASGTGPVEVIVSGPGFPVRSVRADGLGRFRLTDVPAGVDRLHVSDGRVQLTVRLDLRRDER